MKKLISALLVPAMLCTVSAFAAEILPLEGTVVTGVPNGTFPVGFSMSDFEEDNSLFIHLYEEQRYSAEDIGGMQVGDKILFSDIRFDVETIGEEDGFILINDGAGTVNGITLSPDADGTYVATDTVFPVYAQLAVCSVPFADDVVFSLCQADENGSIMGEAEVKTIPCAELKDALIAVNEDTLYPESARITIEDNRIIALEVICTP